MIVVTGAAGFIGSVLLWELNRRGHRDILAVDRLGTDDKWKNLVGLSYIDYVDASAFVAQLEQGAYDGVIDGVLHLGACSSTTETDASYLMENNYRYTLRLAQWCARNPSVRFVYASSAATYGDGEQGYCDGPGRLATLRPLNMYGYSKHLFDCVAQERGWLERFTGLKYFNVYGPNEYHKGAMRSLVCKAWETARATGSMTLFRSHREGYADGEQQRDFVYVKDAVAMTLSFYENPSLGGLYNVGTGVARHGTTWLARCLPLLTSRPGLPMSTCPPSSRIPTSISRRQRCHAHGRRGAITSA